MEVTEPLSLTATAEVPLSNCILLQQLLATPDN